MECDSLVNQNNERHRTTRILDPDEIEDMLKAIEKDKSIRALRNKIIIILLITTGIKSSELINLKISNVGMTNGEDVIEIKNKNGACRRMPIDKKFRKLITEYLRSRHLSFFNKELLLIVNHSSNAKNQNEPLTSKGINTMLKKVAEKAQLDSSDINSRCFRHTFAVNNLEAGKSLEDIQKIMGHSYKNTTRYITIRNKSKNHLVDVALRLRTSPKIEIKHL